MPIILVVTIIGLLVYNLNINNEKTRLLINEFGCLNENQKDFVLEMTNLIKKNLQ